MGKHGEQQTLQTESPAKAMLDEIRGEIEKESAADSLEEQKRKLDGRLYKLQQKMFEFADLYGMEDFRTQLMIQMHEVALLMQDNVNLIEGVTTTMQYLFETVSFLDEMLKVQEDLMTGSLTKTYGPISRIKDWIRVKRTTSNIRNRMAMLTARIEAIQGISHVIVDAMTSETQKMQQKMQKNNERAKKRGISSMPSESKSAQMVRDHLASRNGNHRGNADAETPPPAPKEPPKDGGDEIGNVDDIM